MQSASKSRSPAKISVKKSVVKASPSRSPARGKASPVKKQTVKEQAPAAAVERGASTRSTRGAAQATAKVVKATSPAKQKKQVTEVSSAPRGTRSGRSASQVISKPGKKIELKKKPAQPLPKHQNSKTIKKAVKLADVKTVAVVKAKVEKPTRKLASKPVAMGKKAAESKSVAKKSNRLIEVFKEPETSVERSRRSRDSLK